MWRVRMNDRHWDVNTLSFFDGYMEGEQMTRFKTGYFLPEAVYATGYSGLPWGWS